MVSSTAMAVGGPELLVALLVLVLLVGLVAVVLVVSRARAPGDLIPCRACQRKLSPRATTCPHCGEPRQVLRG